MDKKTRFWFLVSFALFGLLIGMLGCVRTPPYTAEWMQPIPQRADGTLLAMTTCDLNGRTIIIYNETLYRSPDVPKWAWKYAQVHEKQHAADMQSHQGGCGGAMEQYQKDPNYRMMLELRARCSEWKAMVSDGFITQPTFQYLAIFTDEWRRYGQHLSKELFWETIPCNPP